MKHFLLSYRLLLAGLPLLLAFHPRACAQTAERRTSLGINLSGLQYQGDYGSDYWRLGSTKYAAGLAINQYLGRGIDLSSQVFYGELTGGRGADTQFATSLINLNLGFKLKLNNGWALKETAFIQPYLLAAPGWTYASRTGQFNGRRIDLDKGYLDLFAAAGINLRLGRGVGLFIQSGQHLPLKANFDGTQEKDTPRWADRFLQHTVGLTFNMGQAADQDEDDVPDRQDKCPNTPQGVAVDANGCPRDGDGDGVPDHLDSCPTEAGTIELRGCPDADNDGITDSEDACPDAAGKAELKGCPDADNDGVIDLGDKCSDTPAGTAVDEAGCPIKVEPSADPANPDADGDGVPNEQDSCPGTAGPATNRGCPVLKDETRQNLQDATRSIGFELNRATLLPSSFAALDALVPLLNEYPDYSLSIAGHTDSKGPAAFNLTLARERAAAARRYLLGKGVDAARISTRGYGAAHPVATNATEAGRSRNRRVEFDMFLTSGQNSAQVKYGPEPTMPVSSPKAKPGKGTPVRKAAPVRKASTSRKPRPAPPKKAGTQLR